MEFFIFGLYFCLSSTSEILFKRLLYNSLDSHKSNITNLSSVLRKMFKSN